MFRNRVTIKLPFVQFSSDPSSLSEYAPSRPKLPMPLLPVAAVWLTFGSGAVGCVADVPCPVTLATGGGAFGGGISFRLTTKLLSVVFFTPMLKLSSLRALLVANDGGPLVLAAAEVTVEVLLGLLPSDVVAVVPSSCFSSLTSSTIISDATRFTFGLF